MKTSYAIQAAPILPSAFTDELKTVYLKFFRRAFAGAVIIHLFIIAAYGGYSYYKYFQQEDAKNKIQQRVVNITLTDLEPPPSLNEEEELPPPKVEAVTTPVKDLEAMVPEPVAKEKAEVQTIKTQKELEEIKTPVSNISDTAKYQYSGIPKIIETKIEEKLEKKEKPVTEEKEKTVYQSFEVEKAPECINLQQVKGLMKYPDIARESGIEGRVTVKVLVNEEGRVIKVGAITGNEVFIDEVRDKVTGLEFTPGLQNGKAVKVWVAVPFSFKLKDN